MTPAIVALSARPDLAPLVAGWLKDAFDHPPGGTVEDGTARLLLPPDGPEETFILFHASQPVGTASLSHDDLDVRPDLTPWLAGVYVEPAFRKRGFATALVQRVEACALSAGVPTLWLYTTTAEPLYRRLGWQRTGTERSHGREVTLMSRSLTG